MQDFLEGQNRILYRTNQFFTLRAEKNTAEIF